MTERLVNTSGWSLDELARYGKDITGAVHKLIERFPKDLTLDSFRYDLMHGEFHLWLMLNGDEFKGIVMTDTKTVEATNHKVVRIIGLAGLDGLDLVPHIETIERWAWEHGADEVAPVGRIGWKKLLEPLGYGIERVVYTKSRPAA